MWQAYQAVPALSAYIDPDPHITETTWVPPVSGDAAKSWILTTHDSPETVRQFYLTDAQRWGWMLEPGTAQAGEPLLIFRKGRAQMTIGLSTQGAGGTSIIYMLKKQEG